MDCLAAMTRERKVISWQLAGILLLSALTENSFIRLVGIESIPGGAMAARMPDGVDVRDSRKGKTRRGMQPIWFCRPRCELLSEIGMHISVA